MLLRLFSSFTDPLNQHVKGSMTCYFMDAYTVYVLIEASWSYLTPVIRGPGLYWKQADIRDRPLFRFEENGLPVI